jgi:hypothetical protein
MMLDEPKPLTMRAGWTKNLSSREPLVPRSAFLLPSERREVGSFVLQVRRPSAFAEQKAARHECATEVAVSLAALKRQQPAPFAPTLAPTGGLYLTDGESSGFKRLSARVAEFSQVLVLLLAVTLSPIPLHAAESSSFRTSILPILTKAGCNSGACHGAATGQGGFKLSLLGYDPEEDYERITRELGGRRLDLDNPAESLFLRKPTREIEHEGGRRIVRHSEAYTNLLLWIRNGAAYGPRDLRVEEITVTPDDRLLPSTNQSFSLRVQARLSNGSAKEVTHLALFTSNDEAVAEVTKTGQVTTRGPGLTSIMVRYSGQVAAARVAVPFGEGERQADEVPAHNFIDHHVAAELARLRLPSSGLSTDGEFLRRVYLDLSGRLPSMEKARDFLQTPTSSGDRSRVIDDLLSSEDFIDLWTMRLADLLLISGKRGNESGTRVYHQWLRQQLAQNVPLDQVARALLTAEGDLAKVGPANLFTLASDPRDLAEHVSRIFLGTQIACARCHAHPSDRWTQDDYYGFAAFFARLSRDNGAIRSIERGELDHPKTGRPVTPRLLGGTPQTASGRNDRRVELAAWLTAPDNPFFARSVVNRVWKHLLGRGLVEPVDDLRPTNPPTHPGLLDALAADFVANRYDLRRLVRVIVSSRTYQLTSTPRGLNRLDDRFYSHARLKELPAQVFLDAVADVTGVPDHFEGYPGGTRSVELIGSQTPSYALDVLGRCARERACDGPASAGGGLAQALHLINGSTISDKLRGGIIEQLVAQDSAPREIIAHLYLRAFARRPASPEMEEWEAMLNHAGDRTSAIQDLLWTILNSREFAFNH